VPFYSIVVHGQAIRIPQLEGAAPLVGFYAPRVVWARSEQRAREKATELVERGWASNAWAAGNVGSKPALSIRSCSIANIASWLGSPNKGHVFYPEEKHAV
jgi:hypothetical protein